MPKSDKDKPIDKRIFTQMTLCALLPVKCCSMAPKPVWRRYHKIYLFATGCKNWWSPIASFHNPFFMRIRKQSDQALLQACSSPLRYRYPQLFSSPPETSQRLGINNCGGDFLRYAMIISATSPAKGSGIRVVFPLPSLNSAEPEEYLLEIFHQNRQEKQFCLLFAIFSMSVITVSRAFQIEFCYQTVSFFRTKRGNI